MASTTTDVAQPTGTAQVPLPYITIKFCVQCKWNLRAAYFAQELLQTFSTSIGSISLVPVTGGIFTITILHASEAAASDPSTTSANPAPTKTLLWDRKTEGGFPETKELKNRVRNIIDPSRDMGHIDRRLKKDRDGKTMSETVKSTSIPAPALANSSIERVGSSTVSEAYTTQKSWEECEDCK